MEALVTFVTINKRGQEQRDQRRVAGPLLGIGRGSQSQIHLPDARVALNHARITVTEVGPNIERADGLVRLNGSMADRAPLAVGDTVEIGPYELRVEAPPDDMPLALTVSQGEDFVIQDSVLSRVSLSMPRLSRRRLAYLGFWGVALLCLIVPVIPVFWGGPPSVASDSDRAMLAEVVPAVADRFVVTWNPGPVSRGHQLFGEQCRNCHERPFVPVRDAACIECHKNIKEHVPSGGVTGVRGEAFLQMRCAECHREHRGTQLAPRAQELCAGCHADVKAVAREAQSGNVTDFSRDHPKFRLSLVDADWPKLIRRVRQGTPQPAEMVERSNLKYSHKVHLDPAGVRDPQKRRTVLKCGDCHEPADGGRLMAPVSMERHCQRCHLLAFEPKVTDRQVPHGSEKAVATMLREFYARLVLGDVPPGVTPPPDLPRMRPGAVLDYQDRQRALRIADEAVRRTTRELYETPRKVCSICHYVSRDAGGDWKVAPVRIAAVWMPKALFDHAQHAAEKCSSCHDVARSKDARDIAIPDIASCRQCHVGAQAVKNKVTSDCASCHRFHAGRDPWHKSLQAELQTKNIR
jgi:predicted CXXCH cytochrome family protein